MSRTDPAIRATVNRLRALHDDVASMVPEGSADAPERVAAWQDAVFSHLPTLLDITEAALATGGTRLVEGSGDHEYVHVPYREFRALHDTLTRLGNEGGT